MRACARLRPPGGSPDDESLIGRNGLWLAGGREGHAALLLHPRAVRAASSRRLTEVFRRGDLRSFLAHEFHRSMRYGVIGSPPGSGPGGPGPNPGTAARSASPPAGSQLRIWAAAVSAVSSARPRDRELAPRWPKRAGGGTDGHRLARTVCRSRSRGPFSSMAEHRARIAEDAGPVPARGSQAGTGTACPGHRPAAHRPFLRRSQPDLTPRPTRRGPCQG